MHNISEKIDRAVQKIKSLGGDKVRFILLYGSASVGRMKEDSDIDICVYYDGADASEFRLKVLTDLFYDIYDIKIFQQLPYHIHIRTKLMISRPILSTSPDASGPVRPRPH